MPAHTFILVLDEDVVVVVDVAAEDALHHQHELVVRDLLVVDRDAPDVVTKLHLRAGMCTRSVLRQRITFLFLRYGR